MVFWLDEHADKSRENTNQHDISNDNDASGGIRLATDGTAKPRAPMIIDKIVVNDPMRPVDQDGRTFTPLPRKPYAKQNDRYLKRLPIGERRKQIRMRWAIKEEIDSV